MDGCPPPLSLDVILTGMPSGAAVSCMPGDTLLSSKGVPEQEIPSRIASITEAIGENGIHESFATFDPWQALKARCRGKVRIVKPAEMKQKS